MSAVEARFGGWCGACEDTIHVGERIVKDPLDYGAQSWIHEKCPNVGRMEIVRPVCNDCYTERAVDGSCMCVDGAS